MNTPSFLVSIHCMTYNHAPYIEDAMNGFCMQQTSFPYVAIIVDDASTDGEPEVIRRYLNAHFDMEQAELWETDDAHFVYAQHQENKNCFFAVILLKYNFWQAKKAKGPLMKRWTDTKYVALCEGDDYWIVSNKMEKQLEILERFPDMSMCCSRFKRYSVKDQQFKQDGCCQYTSGILSPQKIITKGGLYIATCSILIRKDITKDYPEYCKLCHVGDYPLQIMCAMKGTCYYIHEEQVVYRIDNPNSWVGKRNTIPIDDIIKGIRSEIDMLKGFSKNYPTYKKAFNDRIAFFINIQIKYNNENNSPVLKEFSKEIKEYSLFWKWHLKTRTDKNKFLSHLFYKLFKNRIEENFF